ncbi:phnB protein [alpha proteobacterium U9-1i]|nr:phnB protein [alpha proteobacterium U9-1i]
MRYMLLIYSAPTRWVGLSDAEIGEVLGAYRAFSEALAVEGKLVSADELAPTNRAKSVTRRHGAKSVIDGPYVDTKEALGGYYLIEVADEAEALTWAARCPGAAYGGIEVRPMMIR